MSERLTRKEIKQDIRQDEVRNFLGKMLLHFEERPMVYVGAVVAIVVLGALGSGLYMLQANKADEANTLLGDAIRVAGAPIDATGAKPDDRLAPSFPNEAARKTREREALDKVKGGVAADIAELYRADLALADGDKAKARKIWEDFLDDHQDHALAMSVRLNLIELDREEGRAQQVADSLQKELSSSSKTLPEDVILFELARTQEQLKNTDEAKKLYQRILDEYPTSAYSGDARRVVTGGAEG
jgi:TolA-binding protein